VPLDSFGAFFYALMVVTLYTSPIVLGVLVVSYRQGYFKKGLLGVILALPIAALIAIGLFRLDMATEGAKYNAQSSRLENLFDLETAFTRYYGEEIGTVVRGGYTYTQYRFQFQDHGLELTLPPGNVTSVATLDQVEETAQARGVELWLLGRNARYDPVVGDRDSYFIDHLGVPAPAADVIFMRLYAGSNSSVKYWVPDQGGSDDKTNGQWRHQMLIIDF
tara:strand:+ start:3561 stop:4220 length:660 start_codon:yes stop_codon:yes gene_type:complete